MWPWKRACPPDAEIEESRRLLARAKAREPRTRRVAKATDRAIIQNHMAESILKAMEGR